MKQGSQPVKMKDVLPSTHDYIVPPPTDEEAKQHAQKQLLAFMSMSPGATPFFEV